jgi:hypothetical protein
VNQQRADTNSTAPETQANQSTVLMYAEAEVGVLDSVVCSNEGGADLTACD